MSDISLQLLLPPHLGHLPLLLLLQPQDSVLDPLTPVRYYKLYCKSLFKTFLVLLLLITAVHIGLICVPFISVLLSPYCCLLRLAEGFGGLGAGSATAGGFSFGGFGLNSNPAGGSFNVGCFATATTTGTVFNFGNSLTSTGR